MSGIRFIVPFGRDGAADRAARAFCFGRGWAIENLPGSGGLLGVQRANELAAAGEPVLLLGTPTTHILLPARLGDAAAPGDSFQPHLGLGSAPNVLLVSPRLGARSVGELIAKAKREPLVYASAGTGQTIHVCTALFCQQAGIRMTHKPYDGGSATAYDDLIAGHAHVYFDNLLGCRDRIEQGHAVPLAVSDTQRSAMLPQVPTLAECGIPGHALDVWLGIFGAHCFDALPRLGESVSADSGFSDELRRLGLSGGPIDADALALQVDKSTAGWRRAFVAADSSLSAVRESR